MLEKTHAVQASVTTGVFLYTGGLQQRLTRSHLDPTYYARGQAWAAVSGRAAGQPQPDFQNPPPQLRSPQGHQGAVPFSLLLR